MCRPGGDFERPVSGPVENAVVGGWCDKGPKTRGGFVATTTINRHDFGVSWNAKMDNGGFVVGDQVEITIDVEAILESQVA